MRLIVVGAGIAGASRAYAAGGLGAEVVLADAGLPGQATAAGAGIICPWSSHVDDAAWYAFACAAARRYPALVAELAGAGAGLGESSYRQVGALIVARDEDEAGRECEQILARRAVAPEIGDVGVLGAGQARTMFPPLRPDVAAAYVGGAARVDGRLVTSASFVDEEPKRPLWHRVRARFGPAAASAKILGPLASRPGSWTAGSRRGSRGGCWRPGRPAPGAVPRSSARPRSGTVRRR